MSSSSDDWELTTAAKPSKGASAKPKAAAAPKPSAKTARPPTAAKAKPAPKPAKADDGGLAAVAAREAAALSEALLDSALLSGLLAAAKATAPRVLPPSRALLAAARAGRDVVKSAAARKHRQAQRPAVPTRRTLTASSLQLPVRAPWSAVG